MCINSCTADNLLLNLKSYMFVSVQSCSDDPGLRLLHTMLKEVRSRCNHGSHLQCFSKYFQQHMTACDRVCGLVGQAMKLKLLIFCVASSSGQANGAWLVVALFVAASPAFDCISAGYVICQQMDVDAAMPLLDVLPSNCTV